MHTASSVHIFASREEIFPIVSDLERWPEWLPHYRWIKILGDQGNRKVVKMGARRSGIPISWVSSYVVDTQALEMRFEHLQAWTKGMVVVWSLTPTRDGTRVEIVHDLKFRVPALAWFAEPIIGGFFIDHVAHQTLKTFKKLIEARYPESRPKQESGTPR